MPARYTQRTGNGLTPNMYQTYQVLAPLHTHWRHAKCSEVDCAGSHPIRCEDAGCGHHENGWRTVLPQNSPLCRDVRASGRTFIELPPDSEGKIHFTFPPGQQCFAGHMSEGGPCQMKDRHLVSLERPGLYVVREGDRRDRTGWRQQFKSPELWAEHFAEHQDKVRDQRGM